MNKEKEMFDFRIINTPDGNQVIDRTLKTPEDSLTAVQMMEYMETEATLSYIDRMERKAKERMQKAPKKTKGYYIFDLDTQSKYYMTKGRIKFPKEIRELIYHNADGRCVLCGRRIIYDDMTLDHVTPLAMGGHDSVENLACTCRACNLFKGSVLPSDFMERITDIFLYQMERRHKGSMSWKIVHKILSKMI